MTHQIGNIHGVAKVGGANNETFDDDDLDTSSAMDARLTALGYTDEQIAHMTENDKVYAIRVEDNPSTVK